VPGPGGKRYTGDALVLFPSLDVSMVLCGASHSLAIERLARTGLACIPFKRLHTFFYSVEAVPVRAL
jgi:hypothetical protein